MTTSAPEDDTGRGTPSTGADQGLALGNVHDRPSTAELIQTTTESEPFTESSTPHHLSKHPSSTSSRTKTEQYKSLNRRPSSHSSKSSHTVPPQEEDDDLRPTDDELGDSNDGVVAAGYAAGIGNRAKEKEGVIMVDWDGPDDPCNPRNWSYKKKWGATAIVSAFTFMSPISSSMIAPATAQVSSQFGITNSVVEAMVTSIFVLAYAVGPLFLGPLSELYGRTPVIQSANIFFCIWNIACGFAQNTGQLLAFRFLAGLGGSAPLAIGGGVLGDCWRTEERGRAIALYSLAPLLGPVVGPVAGAWIAEKTTWRWVFWSTSIVNVMVQVLGLMYLRETFAPILLERKAIKLKKEMGIAKDDTDRVRTPYQSADRHWKRLFAKSIIRPFALFAREPIIQLLGIYMAFVYGLIYLILTTIPTIYQGVYGERVGIAGLHYIALGVGLTGASQLNARMMDRIYVYLSEREGRKLARKAIEEGNEKGETDVKRVGRPEFRLPSMVPGTIFLPIGLLMNGWAAENHVQWIVPDIGIAFIGAGMILNFQSIQTYVIDAFTLHAASALAAVSCLRSLAGFGFPLFAPTMYQALGFGKGDTVLAACAIVIGCPAPWLFWHYGERIRGKSRYAASSGGS